MTNAAPSGPSICAGRFLTAATCAARLLPRLVLSPGACHVPDADSAAFSCLRADRSAFCQAMEKGRDPEWHGHVEVPSEVVIPSESEGGKSTGHRQVRAVERAPSKSERNRFLHGTSTYRALSASTFYQDEPALQVSTVDPVKRAATQYRKMSG